MQCIIPIAGQKQCHPNDDKHEFAVTKKRLTNTGDTKESKKYGCVCTCCHIDNLPRYKCVIFLTKNYNFDIPTVANALAKRHREIRQKEFICKPCHQQLKDGKYSSNVQNCDHSDLFGSHVNHEQCSEDNIHDSRTHNENNVTCDLPSLYMTQTTILTNYCLCTCCHKTDIPKSQCIIFKASKYNFDNAIVQEALSNRFSIPTSKEYICKKCDKYLLVEKMPINSIASQMRSISHKQQQKCIHCHTVPTDNFLTFDKTKYGENTLVNNMTINGGQNIICNKCHNAILRESLVTCLTCDKTMKKMLTLKFDMDKYSSLENTT